MPRERHAGRTRRSGIGTANKQLQKRRSEVRSGKPIVVRENGSVDSLLYMAASALCQNAEVNAEVVGVKLVALSARHLSFRTP